MAEIRGQVGGRKYTTDRNDSCIGPSRSSKPAEARSWEPFEDCLVTNGTYTVEFLADRLNREESDVIGRMRLLGINPAHRTAEYAAQHRRKPRFNRF